jgi:hypothetical protein
MNLIEDENDEENDSKVAIFPFSHRVGGGWGEGRFGSEASLSYSFKNPKKLRPVGLKLAVQISNDFGRTSTFI